MKNIFKPQLFSAPMIQGILKDTKSQTRRTNGLEKINKDPDKIFFNLSNGVFFYYNKINRLIEGHVKCPWSVGDILWVRETFYPKEIYDEPPGDTAHYKASDSFASSIWKPSIHMPKKACRLFLKVKSVRIERLQNISEKDCIAEGVSDRLKHDDLDRLSGLNWIIPSPYSCYQFGFLALWCKLYGTENWLNNPWVWVIEFERIDKPLDFII